ncbi:hypothetical protein CEXT_805071 [Caerostris extrusa]|uniref:Uncharacterized protein n=1 Tax=Caerostris extrusa TaxID=172846 RepID=A0AAV4TA35_CAEEX|nr:hypothetical protein CEXT_805071 [Caerostris extrusa]
MAVGQYCSNGTKAVHIGLGNVTLVQCSPCRFRYRSTGLTGYLCRQERFQCYYCNSCLFKYLHSGTYGVLACRVQFIRTILQYLFCNTTVTILVCSGTIPLVITGYLPVKKGSISTNTFLVCSGTATITLMGCLYISKEQLTMKYCGAVTWKELYLLPQHSNGIQPRQIEADILIKAW